jgi:hypothetical protein
MSYSHRESGRQSDPVWTALGFLGAFCNTGWCGGVCLVSIPLFGGALAFFGF